MAEPAHEIRCHIQANLEQALTALALVKPEWLTLHDCGVLEGLRATARGINASLKAIVAEQHRTNTKGN